MWDLRKMSEYDGKRIAPEGLIDFLDQGRLCPLESQSRSRWESSKER